MVGAFLKFRTIFKYLKIKMYMTLIYPIILYDFET